MGPAGLPYSWPSANTDHGLICSTNDCVLFLRDTGLARGPLISEWTDTLPNSMSGFAGREQQSEDQRDATALGPEALRSKCSRRRRWTRHGKDAPRFAGTSCWIELNAAWINGLSQSARRLVEWWVDSSDSSNHARDGWDQGGVLRSTHRGG